MSGYSCSFGFAAGYAKIAVVAREEDPTLEELKALPHEAKVVFRALRLEEFLVEEGKRALNEANVLLNCGGSRELLRELVPLMPNLVWIHSRSAGVDHILFPELRDSEVKITNARGLFSSSLSEYILFICLYFAKDGARWKRQQRERIWDQYPVEEIKGKTLGVIGYGDIGQVAARRAKNMGMKIIGQRRRPELSEGDGVVDEMFGEGQVGEVIARSDYIVVAAALTEKTRGMVGAKELARAQPHAVIINVGRGPIIDEDAMVAMLKSGGLRGAGLDVFCKEPLPKEHPLWGLDNVLLSPHNADLTTTFLHDSVRTFAQAVPAFIAGGELGVHLVNSKEGY